MTGSLLGAVQLKDGEERTLTVPFDINTICTLEARLELRADEIIAKFQETGKTEVDLTFLRTLFWASLLEHHDDISEKDAGRLIGRLGVQAVGEAIAQSLQAAFPTPEKPKAPKGPRKAAAAGGTGKSSS